MPTKRAKTDLLAIVAKAKDLQAEQRRWRRDRGESAGATWSMLPDWAKLSWYMEAADTLGMEL